MNSDWLGWAGFFVSFAVAFLLSLFHVSLSGTSKISISRILEDREKTYRIRIIEIFDELKISVEFLRTFFLIAFLTYTIFLFDRFRFWPLWFFLGVVGAYIVFFETLPRLIVSANKRATLDLFLPSFRIPLFLARPVLFFTRFKGQEKDTEESREASDEEIQALIEKASEEGIIEEDEGDLIKSVVEFGDTIVKEIMTPRVSMVCISKEASVNDLRKLVIAEKHSRIPVFTERIDNIEGIVIAQDLIEYSEDKFKTASIEPLIRPVHFIPESMKVSELLKELQKKKQKLAVVVDEHGGVSGLVTMEDLVEEIVGEIQDEYDEDEGQIIQKGPMDYIVSGDVDVEELEELFDLELAEDDYVTIGGLITHSLGRFPERGENLSLRGLSLDILDIDAKRIKKVRVKKDTP